MHLFFYGTHAVKAALANPKRLARELLYSRDEPSFAVKIRRRRVSDGQLAKLLPNGAVHQGLALEVSPLESPPLARVAAADEGIILALDQLQDPRNVGAIMRSAAFFGVRAIIAPRRHFPAESGALAKAASGALEEVPIVRVANLNNALGRTLVENGWRIIGLAADADKPLADYRPSAKTVLVLGGEERGLRRLVGENCDELFSLGESRGVAVDSLNVSAAATLAIYTVKLNSRPS